jgi:hypothetical protein
VDGGDANHATLCRALTGADLSHAYVRSGVGALEQLATNRFKVALPDASLSDTDGVASLRKRLSEMQPPGIIVMRRRYTRPRPSARSRPTRMMSCRRRFAPPTLGPVVAIPQVGGLHHRYERRAA